MTPYHHYAVPIICVVVLAAIYGVCLHTLVMTSLRTPPGRPQPRSWPHPLDERRRDGRRGK